MPQAIQPLFGLGGGLAGLALTGGNPIGFAIGSAIGNFAGGFLASSFNKSSGAIGPNITFPEINTRDEEAAIPVIYGERLIGGNIFFESGGDKQRGFFIGLAEGPIHGITEFRINEEPIMRTPQSFVNYTLHDGDPLQAADPRLKRNKDEIKTFTPDPNLIFYDSAGAGGEFSGGEGEGDG